MIEKPMTNDLRNKIKEYIKNKLDISNLINGVCIKGEDLSYSIIKYINKNENDISNCSFSYATIGCEDKISSFIRCRMINCNFQGTQFIGRTWMRHCDAKKCNFKNANVALVDYQFTDFREGTFCGAIIKIDTRGGIGCRFPSTMFEELTKGWSMKIKVEE